MSKITQKNYEAIAIYRQKEKLFELKGKIQSLETENTKLKELLKRTRKELNDCPTWLEGSWKAELIDEINQLLQEKR